MRSWPLLENLLNEMPKKLRKVIVKWRDAADCPETWCSEDEVKSFAKEDVLVETTGLLYSKTAKYLVIVGDVIKEDEGNTYGRVTKIPLGMVVKITSL